MRNFNRLLALGLLCAAAAGFGLAGCSTDKEAKETGRTPDQVKTDKAISKQVAEALKTAPVYKYPQVQVTTDKGAVALSGFVRSEGQKQEASRIAEQFATGGQVHNNLVVQPLTPTGPTGQQNPGTAPGAQPAPPPQYPPQDQAAPQQPK
jgi:hypothetical protein